MVTQLHVNHGTHNHETTRQSGNCNALQFESADITPVILGLIYNINNAPAHRFNNSITSNTHSAPKHQLLAQQNNLWLSYSDILPRCPPYWTWPDVDFYTLWLPETINAPVYQILTPSAMHSWVIDDFKNFPHLFFRELHADGGSSERHRLNCTNLQLFKYTRRATKCVPVYIVTLRGRLKMQNWKMTELFGLEFEGLENARLEVDQSNWDISQADCRS